MAGNDQTTIGAERVLAAVDDHRTEALPRLDVLWSYYRNEVSGWWWQKRHRGPVVDRSGIGPGVPIAVRTGQEGGLPARLWGAGQVRERGPGDTDNARREIVIENDIAWRVHTMIDFLFGRPIKFIATGAGDGNSPLARRIELALESAWEASGGMGLLQDAALIAHVYGSADLLVRVVDKPAIELAAGAGEQVSDDDLVQAARAVRVEVIEPRRGVGLVSATDYRKLDGYVLLARPKAGDDTEKLAVLTAAGGRVYKLSRGRDGRASLTEVSRRDNVVCPGRLPVVRLINVSEPFSPWGMGEVEPLMALQDELNTRLSDRANRVTLQSFKMYLAKGVEGFARSTVTPGAVWSTDNPDATITAFGGDGSSPSELAHIAELRQAMDKVSGVPPLATGVVQAKVGNLSSESALRLTLQGLLGKTARKRLTYGRGLAEISSMILECLNRHGVLITSPEQRTVSVRWPDPIVGDAGEQARAAAEKAALGVPRAELLAELGYAGAERAVE